MPVFYVNAVSPHKPKLLDLVRQAIRTKHYSLRTEQAYVQWVKRYILYHNKRHPQDMAEKEINQYLTYLAVQKNVASSTQNQALCAIIFLYREVLKRDIGDLEGLVWAKKPKKLPVVLTRDEVKALLAELSGMNRIMATILYGAGLRHTECLRLRVKDLDFTYQQITIRDAKGKKDRFTVLPKNIRKQLQQHLQSLKKQHKQDLAEGYGSVYLPYETV